jgi:hypothetical protein
MRIGLHTWPERDTGSAGAQGRRVAMAGKLGTTYLIAYNAVQALGWAYVLFLVASSLKLGPEGLLAVAGPPVWLFQGEHAVTILAPWCACTSRTPMHVHGWGTWSGWVGGMVRSGLGSPLRVMMARRAAPTCRASRGPEAGPEVVHARARSQVGILLLQWCACTSRQSLARDEPSDTHHA